MRAKFAVSGVLPGTNCETVVMSAVCGDKQFGPNGESEDNTFARYTPSASLSITITNPDLLGKLKEGQKFYVDFAEADVAPGVNDGDIRTA